LSRLEQGQGLADDFDLLDGHWDLTDRLSLAFREADLRRSLPIAPRFSLSGGERMKALLCGAFVSGADYLLLDEPTNHLDRQGGVALSPTGKLAGRGSDRQPRPRAADADAEDY
jgi:ATPase subunit of ABC transporter with duplicated ATPase domains